MSGNLSARCCVSSYSPFLDSFLVPTHHLRTNEITPVFRKPPTPPLLKVNTDDSIIGAHASCGGIFWDHLGTFLDAFTCNLCGCSIFNAKILGYIWALEYATQNGWWNIMFESDSTGALLVFKNYSLVSISYWNRWHYALPLGVQIMSSHIFCEGNCCAYELVNMGHLVRGSVSLNESRVLVWSPYLCLCVCVCVFEISGIR